MPNQSSHGSNLANILKDLERRYGTHVSKLLGNDDSEAVDIIPTGIMSLDHATGVWGIPRGRFTEIFSPEGCGKTTLAIQIAINAVNLGLGVAYIDMEHKFDVSYAKKLGMDLSKMYFAQPSYGEAALNVARALVESGEFGLIVVDSVASLVPKSELDGTIGDSLPGLQARMMSQSLRILSGAVQKYGAAVLFINQLRQSIGMGGFSGPSEVTPGGIALRYYASMRIKLGIIKRLKDKNDLPVGQEVKATVVKSSIGIPYRTTILTLYYGSGFDKYADLVDAAINIGVIEKSGAWLTYKGNKLQGRGAMIELLRLDSMAYDEIYKIVLEILGGRDESKSAGSEILGEDSPEVGEE